jgi:predicted transposase YdaD
MEMPNVWDDALKKLLRASAQDFVALVQKDLHAERMLPTELDAEHIYADGLLKCTQADGQEMLVHFEFQKKKDKRMGERLLEYNVLASRLNDYLPVRSCVIYLKKSLKMPTSPFLKKLPDGEENIRFHYKCIALWTMTVEEILAMGLVGLFPFLALTKNGRHRPVIDIMIKKLVEAEKTEFLWIGYALSSEMLKRGDQDWLKRRFSMFEDMLSDTPVYQEVFAKGKDQGFAEGEAKGIETGKMQALSQTRQTASRKVLELVKDRFPALEAQARKCVEEVGDTDALLDLLVKIGIARTKQEAGSVLQR